MKLQKLIDKTEEILRTDDRKLREKKKYLKKAMKALREHEEELEEKYKSGFGNAEKLSQEMALVHAQRKKGLVQLRELHKARKKKQQKNPDSEIRQDDEDTSA